MKKILPTLAVNLLLFILLDLLVGSVYMRKVGIPRKNQAIRISHPTYDHSLKPMIKGYDYWGADSFLLITNSLGFRDREQRDVPLTTSKYRVVWLGDSFTEGIGYDYEETFVGMFDVHSDTSVEHLNMGVASYSPELHNRKLGEFLEKGLKIDRLNVCLDVSDIQDEIFYSTQYYKTPKLDEYMDRSFLHRLPFFIEYANNNIRSLTLALVRKSLGMENRIYNPKPTPIKLQYTYERERVDDDTELFERWGRTGVELMAKNMDRILDSARKRGIEVSVVIYPWPHTVEAGLFENEYTRFWKDYCKRNGVELINLFESFRKFSDLMGSRKTLDSLYLKDDVHFNRAGNRFVYEEILKTTGDMSRKKPGCPRPLPSQTSIWSSDSLFL
jgi:hypothetical protein